MISSSAFAERYLVASFDTEGVVVDLETGNYFRVDGVTARICDILISHPKSALDLISSKLSVDAGEAGRIVADVRLALNGAAIRGTPTGPYHFHPEDGGYGLWHDRKRVLGVAGDNLDICMPPDGGIEKNPLLEFYVRALAPKLMSLRGLSVVHASACFAHRALFAFAGQSGAGKTTTAHAFVQAGAQLISEDLLIFRTDTRRPSVVLGSEARVHAWAKITTDALAAGATRISSTELQFMANGQDAPLSALCFLDVSRRSGSEFATRSLNGADALLALMANHFLGDASRAGWRRFFDTARRLASPGCAPRRG